MSGHKVSHTQLERYQLIDSLLSDGKLVSFDDILSYLRDALRDSLLSDSSVRRDLRYMRDELGAPFAYDVKNHGWHYTKAFKLPSEGFSEEEILSLHLLRRLLAQHSSEDSFYKTFDSILEKITPKDLSLPDRFYIPSRPKCVIEEGVSEKILLAIKNNFMLDFYYNSKWEPEERHRRIMPFQIVLDEGFLYLYGAKQSNNPNPRLFNLSKMQSVEVISSQPFELPPNFRFHEESEQGRFGAFQYDDYFDFKIEFYGEARKVAREYVWSDNQLLEEDSEYDKSTLTFTTSQWLPVQRWLLSFGAELGISTQKLHARGPMGIKALTTTKYLIDGDGQVR